MMAFLSVLTSKPMAIAAELACVAAGIALLVIWSMYKIDEVKIVQKDHAIAQLQASIEFQNNSINQYKGLADAAAKRSQAAQEASAKARETADRSVTALLNRPLAKPELACKAADDEILEFTHE
jgi:acyl-coenzyme A synthetase/AMP-(fatty) acid ligase